MGPDNPFWTLALRRARRRVDAAALILPLAVVGALLLVWFSTGAIEGDWPYRHRWPYGRWHLMLGMHALLVGLAVMPPAWRLLADAADPANLIELRLCRLRPTELVLAKALVPAAAGLRVILYGLPVHLLLHGESQAQPPPVDGVLLVLGVQMVWALFLGAAAGSATVRMRTATIDDWGDVIFNVRTLVAVFLNPFWVLVGAVIAMSAGPRLAGEWCVRRDWFGHAGPPLTVLLPLAAWVARQAAGLASHVAGESARLARQVVTAWSVTTALLALYWIGHAWTPWLHSGAFAIWWELGGTPPETARLLCFLLGFAAWPLTLAFAYAAALPAGLRTEDRRDFAIAAPSALPRVTAAAVTAGLVPCLVWLLTCLLGGLPPLVMGPAYLLRAGLLWAASAAAASGYLCGLLVLAVQRRQVRELGSIALLVPALAGPFILGWRHPAGAALASCSPIVALLWSAPTAGTSIGMTSDILLPFGWQVVAAAQFGIAALCLAACALALGRMARSTGPAAGTGEALWWRRFANPMVGLDLLSLQRHGALWTPYGMALLPLLALLFVSTGGIATDLVYDTCAQFVWHERLAAGPAVGPLVVVVATLGVQLILHPPGLVGTRCFARDAATGRLESLLASPLTARQLVRGRYLAVALPFWLFLLLAVPAQLVAGVLCPGGWSIAAGGVLHQIALAVLVPAVALAGTVDREWRGQGLIEVSLLELARLAAGRWFLAGVAPEAGVPWLGAALLLAAIPLTEVCLRTAERRLAARGAAA